jgi:hypothetical protein
MALAAKEDEASAFYLLELLDCLMDGEYADGLTVEGARADLAVNEALANKFDEMVARRSHVESGTEPWSLAGTEPAEDTPEQQVWQAQIEAQASVLSTGQEQSDLLHRAAEAYLGIQGNSVEKTPRQRLGDLVGSRVDLIDLLIAGMERTITRNDLPSCDDMVRLLDQGWINWLVLPFVAGLHSLEQSDRLSADDLNESQARLAVTILYMLPRKIVDPDSAEGVGVYRPQWFQALLRDNPALLSDVLRRSAALKLETGVQPASELYELANAEDHREIAKLIAVCVLDHFPRAETDDALEALCWALYAALKNCNWSVLGRVIEKHFERGDQGTAERSCWLATGFLVAPERYRDDLVGLSEDENGLKWLARFMAVGRFHHEITRQLTARDVALLVDTVGAALMLNGVPEGAYWSTSDLIGLLADDPSPAATETLESLLTMTNAKPWAPAVMVARERQTRKRREHEFRHGDIEQVVETLDNQSPANAGDLAALVFDELNTLSRKIRDGSTSDWRQHWNVDSYNRPTKPKPEDACRDAILSDLRERLGRFNIDAQPEGVYADNNRSDIRVSFGGFNVPVEIKRSCHPNLWTAVRSQLIAKYTRDPGAAGHGIYLVLWFGNTEKYRPTKCEDWIPETAEDVRLRIVQSLDDREERLISVCVVDVAAPQ